MLRLRWKRYSVHCNSHCEIVSSWVLFFYLCSGSSTVAIDNKIEQAMVSITQYIYMIYTNSSLIYKSVLEMEQKAIFI